MVLATRDVTSYALINALAERFEVARVIFERQQRWRMLRYRLRKLDLWTTLGQLVFLVWDRLVIQPCSQPTIARLLARYDTRPPDGRLPTLDVEAVNRPEVATILEREQPCVVVVSGTGIIGWRVLEMSDIFLNIHCGITPRYRGVHGGFWAVYEGRPNLAGVTVHVVDSGVDTGAIVGQAPINIDPATDTYRTLPVRQYVAGLPLVLQAVEDALAENLKTYQRSDLDSKQWYSPTLRQHRHFRRRLRDLEKQ